MSQRILCAGEEVGMLRTFLLTMRKSDKGRITDISASRPFSLAFYLLIASEEIYFIQCLLCVVKRQRRCFELCQCKSYFRLAFCLTVAFIAAFTSMRSLELQKSYSRSIVYCLSLYRRGYTYTNGRCTASVVQFLYHKISNIYPYS